MAKIKFGLYARIAFSVILIISLVMFILGFYLVSDAREKFNKERLQQVTASAMTLANGSRDALISDDYELLDFWLRSVLVRDYYAYSYFSRADGVILSHTDMGMVAKKVEALGQLSKMVKRKLRYHRRPVIEVVYPSRLGSRYLGNAHVAYYLDQDTFRDTYNISNIIILVFVLLSCLLIAILYIVRRYTIPVSQLTDYVASLSVADIHRKPAPALLDNQTEVGDLARAFNEMSLRLMRAFQVLMDNEAHLKEQVEERTRSLRAANRELESFSYSVSHDLRAPLRAIDGFTQILEEDYIDSLDEDGRHYMQRIRTGVKRMNELIDDLLQLSRISRQKLDTVRLEIGRMVRRISEDLQENDSQRKVEFIIDDKLCVDADTRLLQIVLENILGNAWKYTAKVEHAVIEFGMQHEGGEDIFYIRDNGAGFDMAYVDKLFIVFERLHKDEDFEGSGVGLATVERIIRRHGGRIWAQAELGKGAAFFFTLRAAVAD